MEIAGKIIDEKWLNEQFERFSEQCIDGMVPSSAIELAKNKFRKKEGNAPSFFLYLNH